MGRFGRTRYFGALALLVAAAGCAGAPDRVEASAGLSGAALTGAVTLDGSATVLPVSMAMAEAFRKVSPNVHITVTSSDTGPGLAKLCRGALDIADASRPITSSEIADCAAHNVGFLELPIAFDSLTVVVSAANTTVDCLSLADLRKIWEPAAEGTVLRWDQVRRGWPSAPLHLFGPSDGSGTYDYFTLATVGTAGSSRRDYTKTADLNVVVREVAADPNALGFFGYAYYAAHRDALRAVPIDDGRVGCVAPSPENVAQGMYQPLARPIFVYVSQTAALRAEVRALADFYVDPHNAALIRTVGYVPLPRATLLAVGRRLDTGVTGSVFGGRGAVLGLTADAFQDEDRLRSAIVR